MSVGATNPYARVLRRDATEVEKCLWQRLRNRQLGNFKFRRQATVGPFIVDFLCAELGLIVELDGGQHGGPNDDARTAWLSDRGYRVIRFWNNEVIENEEGILAAILGALEGPPSPNPLPPAGEG